MHRLFASQLDQEKIYLVLRQHWIFLIGKLFILAIFALVIIGVRTYLSISNPDLLEGQYGGYILSGFDITYLVLVLALLLIITLYYLNMQIITDQRIVDIDQVGLFGRNVSELQLENIEDTTSESHGVLATIFNFGNVFVQTAGAKDRFEFDNVPHPELVKKLVLDLYEKATSDKPKNNP